jgi:16S rRNA (guanine527-N7)-methyltransferase
MEIILKYFSDFTEQQLKQFAALKELYEDWNKKINVISRKDIDSLYEKHILHSLSIAAIFQFDEKTAIIDIGTGGGFPGIPLAIFYPHVKFLLVDSIGKKLKVVEAIATEIGLKNITIQHGRAEEIKNRQFDFVVSRAVAPLKELWKWSKPLLKGSKSQVQRPASPEFSTLNAQRSTFNSGLICLKGGDLAREIQESGTKPRIMEVFEIFPEAWFKEKYILYVQK